MAKGKNSVNVDMNVRGRGVKKTAMQMKDLGKQTDKTSKSTGELNRNWKGASNQSSGASKNFSKMSQGMGGIVGAYATLAANIFAIGAAFRFLESAGDLQKLKEGQILYASATGVALKSLTNDIIAATDAQITFTNASQAAAIGKAAGLTNDQLIRLGKGAKDVSIILGRDVTDSFNRLVRGVTKAEPELLDELGIILRLADASEKYGAVIGKSAQDLTQFEKSQAVTLEVLDQVESKYGRIMAVMEPAGNQFTKLGKSFDDITNHIKEFAAAIATPIAGVLTTQPKLIIGILLALGNTLVKTTLTNWTMNAKESADKYRESLQAAKDKLADLQAQGTKGAKGYKGTARAERNLAKIAGAEGARPAGFKAKSWDLAIAGKGSELTSKQLSGMRAAVKATNAMSDDMKNKYIAAIDAMLVQTKKATKGIEHEFKTLKSRLMVVFRGLQAGWATVMIGMKNLAAGLGMVVTKLLGWVSMLSILYTMGKSLQAWAKGVETIGELDPTPFDIASEKVKALNEEFEKFNAIQRIITEDGQGFLQFFEAMGNKIGQLSVTMQEHLLEESAKAFSEFVQMSSDELVAYQDMLLHDTAVGQMGAAGAKDVLSLEIRMGQIQDNIAKAERMIEAGAGGEKFGGFGTAYSIGETAAEVMLRSNQEMDLIEERLADINRTTTAAAGSLFDYMAIAQNQGIRDFGEFLTGMRESAQVAREAFGPNAINDITLYLDALNKLDNVGDIEIGSQAWKDLVESIFEAQVKAQAYGATITRVTQLQKDNTQESAKLMQDLQKRSTEGRLVDTLKQEIELRKELNDAGFDAPAGMSPEEKEGYRKRGERLEAELALFERIDRAKAADQKRTKALAATEKQILSGKTKLVAARLKLEMGLMKNANKQLKIDDEIAQIQEKIILNKGVMETQQRDMLELLYIEEQALKASNEELERKLSLAYQIGEAFQQSLESGLTKGFKAFMQGKQSITDLLRDLAEGVWDSVSQKVAEQASEAVMSFIGLGEDDTEADRIQNAHIAGADYWVTSMEAMLNSIAREPLTHDMGLSGPGTFSSSIIPGSPEDIAQVNEAGRPLSGAIQPLGWDNVDWSKVPWVSPIIGIGDAVKGYFTEGGAATAWAQFMEDIQPLMDKFDALVEWFSPLIDALKDLTGQIITITQAIPGAIQPLKDFGGRVADKVTGGWNWMKDASETYREGTNLGGRNNILNDVPLYTTGNGGIQFGLPAEGNAFSRSVLDPNYDKEVNFQEVPPEERSSWNMMDDLNRGQVLVDLHGVENTDLARIMETLVRHTEVLPEAKTQNSFYVHDTHVVDAIKAIGTGLVGKKETAIGSGSLHSGGNVGEEGTGTSRTTRTGIFGPVISSFENLFSGEGPWMERLGNFFSGEGSFLKGLSGIFGGLGDIFGQLMGGGGGGWMSLLSLIPFGKGGVIPGGFRKYAGGGIATSPTLGMIGEGRHNEAVVPLPDGKAIPVDMRSTAQNNNVTVNVSSDGQIQTSGNDSEQLGNAIARAVQEELQNQKRAGGILNRYGTA